MSHTILIMAAGTGGHIFPALAVARELQQRGASVHWLGTVHGMESRIVPQEGIAMDSIHISGLRGNGLLGWLKAPWRIIKAVLESRRVIKHCQARAVLGMGGFVTGPGGVAARLAGLPLVIHEQNAIPGLSNRLLSRIATRVMQAFPDSFSSEINAETCGNPVRGDIGELTAPTERYRDHQGPLRILVVGGSLGAAVLNQTVPQALALFGEEQRPRVLHQAGERNIEQARSAYQEAGVEADVRAFINDMGEAYEWCDLVICRAGALTVSELALAGVPALLVPYPYAVDDHQTANAGYLVQSGAAVLMPQNDLTVESLAAFIGSFLEQKDCGRKQLQTMAQAARNIARPEACRLVTDACLEVSGWQQGEVVHD